MSLNSMNLLDVIAGELGIKRGLTEDLTSWLARVVWSALGRAAIASLYDVQEEQDSVSVQHLKNKIETLCVSWLEIFPELSSIHPEKIADKIYEILLNSGCIYHSPNRITASAHREAKSGQVIFLRGAALNQKVHVSGLGTYLLSEKTDSDSSAASMFGLQRVTLSEYYEQLTQLMDSAEVFEPPVNAEFLRTVPPFTSGYFTQQLDSDGGISLMRTGLQYYLYRFVNGKIFARQLRDWQTHEGEYLRIANSIIHSIGNLPAAKYHVDGEIVRLSLKYLYPPAEMNLLKLYSWPGSNNFSFTISPPVFEALKSELERIGYEFTKE